VPNVVGLTQVAASSTITTAGLTVGSVTIASSTTVPSGSVISQNPTAATQVNVGSAVALVVSSGPAQIAVPIVVGLTQTAASSAITGAGLTVGVVSLVQSATVPAGVVISESPTAGTLVAPGSTVSLTVSSGNQVPVPDVVGQAQIAAAAAITNAGLVVGTTTTAPSATMPAGSVITESPTAGTLVAIGSAVSLIVSSGPSLVAVPNVVGMTQAAATASITGASLTLGTVTMTPSVSTPAGLVISQSPGSATQIALGSAVSLVVSSGSPEGAPQMELNVSVDGTSFQLSTPPITTTSANELLVAYVSSDGGSANAQVMTVTGGGLSWTLLRRANASAGTAEIWTAVAPAPLVNAVIKSTANATVNVFHQSLTVMAFPAAAIGELTFGSGSRNQPNLPLTASADSSLVFAVGFDADKPASRTLPAGQISVHEWLDKDANCTFWLQAVADPMISGDTALVTFTAPIRDAWNMVAVEIVPR
jgi:beta-lactam-binding protein with PASTA domain